MSFGRTRNKSQRQTPPEGRHIDIEDMTILGDDSFSIGVSLTADARMKKLLMAALKTYAVGTQSVDYMLKRYGDAWEFPPPSNEEVELLQILQAVRADVESVSNSLCLEPERPAVASGLFAAVAALARLRVTFKTAMLAARRGYVLEVAAMEKLILEQIAWAYAVHEIDGDGFLRLQPQQTIGKLKEFMPAAGIFYGILNEYSHVHPRVTGEFLDFSGDRPVLLLALLGHRMAFVFFLAILADYLRRVAEWVTYDYFGEPLAWYRAEDGSLTLREDRPLSAQIQKARKIALNVIAKKRLGHEQRLAPEWDFDTAPSP